MSAADEVLRPRDFALLLLASGDLAPRQRARDQQADRAGLELKRRVLDAVAERDPEADELEGVLLDLVEELGPPTGPTRSIALAVYEEWQVAAASSGWVAHLLGQAIEESGREESRRGRQLPS